MVVLFRPDCAHCLRLIPKLRERADRGDGAMRLALLDVSAGTAEGSVMGPVGRSAVFGRMKPGTMWIVVPPVGVELVDGQVQRAIAVDHGNLRGRGRVQLRHQPGEANVITLVQRHQTDEAARTGAPADGAIHIACCNVYRHGPNIAQQFRTTASSV